MRKKNKKYTMAVMLALILAAGGLLCACGKEEEEHTLTLSQLVEEQSVEVAELVEMGMGNGEEAGEAQEICYVHVCGAVHNPGVVAVPAGSRAEAAVEAAGGMTQEADSAYINLAASVEDGQQLYIPSMEESAELQQQEEARQAGLVDINKAGIEELCTLPGIGESRAADIVAYRKEHGSFASIEDIMQVSGIKENAFSRIKDKITVQ